MSVQLQSVIHPIKSFIYSLFPKKETQKKDKWVNCLIDNEYQTINDLKSATEQGWKLLADKIPFKIVQDIKKRLKEDSNQMSSEDVQKMLALINSDMPKQQIIKFLDAQQGTPRGDAILNKLNFLFRPPLPYPKIFKKQIIKDQCLPLFVYQGKKDQMRKYFTFLVVGQTGSGKTTLMDAFINKLNGMQLTDNWRWRLVDEESIAKSKKPGESLTDDIHQYYINDVQNQFNIRIFDSPGFGDTGGISKDQQTTYKFKQLFNQIDSIDYVILVVKATQTRLTPSVIYAMDKVQQLFGADAAGRILLMCTFADGNKPECIQKVNEILKFQQYFKFNNSVLYTPQNKRDKTSKFYWKMGVDNIKEFEKYILQKNRLPFSLTQSAQVLSKRQYLCQSIKTSQEQVRKTWKQLDQAVSLCQLMKKNKDKINSNKDFIYYESIKVQIKSSLPAVYQACTRCNTTCCQICKWPVGSLFSQCTYFNSVDACPKCPGRCPRAAHAQTQQAITYEQKQVQKVFQNKKKQYDDGVSGVSRYSQQFKSQVTQISGIVTKLVNQMQGIKTEYQKLQKIALKPKIYSDNDFYLQMIQQEEDSKKPGFAQRIQTLKGLLKNKEHFEKHFEKNVNSSKKVTVNQLFPKLSQLLAEANS